MWNPLLAIHQTCRVWHVQWLLWGIPGDQRRNAQAFLEWLRDRKVREDERKADHTRGVGSESPR